MPSRSGVAAARLGGRAMSRGHHWAATAPAPVECAAPWCWPLRVGRRCLCNTHLLLDAVRGKPVIYIVTSGTGDDLSVSSLAVGP